MRRYRPAVPHLTKRAWLAVAVAVAGLGAAGIAIAGAQGDETPRGTDALSTEELDAATALARGSNPGESTALGADDVVLLVERHEEAKNAPEGTRRADVYVYSYDDDVLTLTVVDLVTGEAESSTVVPNTQLPLVQEEQDRAVQLLTDDPDANQALATAYRQATGRDLADAATDVIVDPIVFRADANPQVATGAARQCGRHRCAQLMLRSSDGLLIDLLPIVDLSAEQVVSESGFFS